MTTDAAGGVWQYSLDLAAGLTSCGAEVLLAALGPSPSIAQRKQVEALAGVQFYQRNYALEWMPEPWTDVDAAGEWVLELQKTFDADIIHLNGYSHAALRWNRPVLSVAHSCVVSWWRAVHGEAPGPEWVQYRERVTRGLHAASAIVAPTVAMARNLQVDYGVAAERVRVIHNFSSSPQPSDTHKEPLIFAAGRLWDQAKNLQLLFNIEPALKWKVQVADGKLSHEAVLKRMATAGIFAHPALYEPFGLSILEAARARCCLVLSDIPSLRELWDEAAVFVEPHDEKGWVKALNCFIDDEQTRAEMAQRAYLVSQRYSRRVSVQQYWTLYEELMRDVTSETKETAA